MMMIALFGIILFKATLPRQTTSQVKADKGKADNDKSL